MAPSMADAAIRRHRELPEKAMRMASADLRKAENEQERRALVGQAFAQACEPWSLKELSAMLHRDERQIARWQSGHEQVQGAAVLGCPPLWARWVVAQARLRPELVEVETVLRVKTA